MARELMRDWLRWRRARVDYQIEKGDWKAAEALLVFQPHSRLEAWRQHIKPYLGGLGRPDDVEDEGELVHEVLAGEERLAAEQLGEDAAHRPHVHRVRVQPVGTQHQLRRTVPPGHHVLLFFLDFSENERVERISGEYGRKFLQPRMAVDQAHSEPTLR